MSIQFDSPATVAQLQSELERERVRGDRWKAQAEKCARLHSMTMEALRNENLHPTTRLIAFHLETEIERCREEGKIDAEGRAMPCISAIADRSGVSASTAGRQVKKLRDAGLIEYGTRRVSDPETGQFRTQVLVKHSGPFEERVRAIAHLNPEETSMDYKRPGGSRERKIGSTCPDCGSEDTELVCRSCGCKHHVTELLPEKSQDDMECATNAAVKHLAFRPEAAGGPEGITGKQDDVRYGELAEVVNHGSGAPTNGSNGNGSHPPDPSFFVPTEEQLAAPNTYVTGDDFAVRVEVARPPDALLAGAQLVGWRVEQRDGKPTKIPVNPRNGHEASSTDPSTWGTREEARAAVKRYGLRGVGRMLRDDFTVFEIDDCRNPETGEIDAEALEIMRRLDSYTEISPSGEGLHIWLRGAKPTQRCRQGRYECYDHARYFTITCKRVTSVSGAIEERPTELATVCRMVFPADLTPVPTYKPQPLLSDSDIYEKLAGNQKFQYLDRGDSASYPSRSEADMAYFCMLARFTSDTALIERIARCSGRAREKWDKHNSYLRDSIERAIQFVGSRP